MKLVSRLWRACMHRARGSRGRPASASTLLHGVPGGERAAGSDPSGSPEGGSGATFSKGGVVTWVTDSGGEPAHDGGVGPGGTRRSPFAARSCFLVYATFAGQATLHRSPQCRRSSFTATSGSPGRSGWTRSGAGSFHATG